MAKTADIGNFIDFISKIDPLEPSIFGVGVKAQYLLHMGYETLQLTILNMARSHFCHTV